MKFVSFLLIGANLLAQQSMAAMVHIADGDCVALSNAAAAAPGSEPSLIVLATRGHYYGGCFLVVTGNITIDGAGSFMSLAPTNAAGPTTAQVQVQAGGSLIVRNINLGVPADSTSGTSRKTAAIAPPSDPALFINNRPQIVNYGNLTIESASLSGMTYATATLSGIATVSPEMIDNNGQLLLRNVTVADNFGQGALISNIGSVEISQSTISVPGSSLALFTTTGFGATYTFANNLFSGNIGCLLDARFPFTAFVSRGGNLSTVSASGCNLSASGDRIVTDAALGAFGDNGGLVDTVLLDGSSVAVRNGVAANCEASDARGVVRNVQARGGCDSGAYEFGGGRGLLSQGGMSGFFYDASADGHYVTVQRLDWGSALVVWNTFDRNGQAAWIYSIGSVDGTHVHAQGAQNLDGVLQAGGAPTGSHGTVWGDIDIAFSNCFGGTFSYNSPLANFGSGQFPLNRLAFLGDLDCSD